MNRAELTVAHGELTRDIQRIAVQLTFGEPLGYDDATVPGEIQPWIMPRLRQYAASIGYPVHHRLRTHLDADVCGETVTHTDGQRYVPGGIWLSAVLTPASQVRTLTHELAHALAHVDAARRHVQMPPQGELEEVIAETCGSLVCRALRVPGDDASARWLAVMATPETMKAARDPGITRAAQILEGIK